MVRRVWGEDDTIGMTDTSKEGIRKDWAQYWSKRMVLQEVIQREGARQKKLRAIAKRRWDNQKRSLNL